MLFLFCHLESCRDLASSLGCSPVSGSGCIAAATRYCVELHHCPSQHQQRICTAYNCPSQHQQARRDAQGTAFGTALAWLLHGSCCLSPVLYDLLCACTGIWLCQHGCCTAGGVLQCTLMQSTRVYCAEHALVQFITFCVRYDMQDESYV